MKYEKIPTAENKILIVLFVMKIVDVLRLNISKNTKRGELVAQISELLRTLYFELQRDITEDYVEAARSCLWRRYRHHLLPTWLHTAFTEMLQRDKPKQ